MDRVSLQSILYVDDEIDIRQIVRFALSLDERLSVRIVAPHPTRPPELAIPKPPICGPVVAPETTYAYNPHGQWTARHQMTLNGKTDNFDLDDFRACANTAGLKRGRDREILAEVLRAVKDWPRFAETAAVLKSQRASIARAHRLHFGRYRRRTK